MERGPEAIAGPAEVSADGGRVETGVNTGEENNQVFGDEIGHALVVSGEELGFGRFPRRGVFPFHRVRNILSARQTVLTEHALPLRFRPGRSLPRVLDPGRGSGLHDVLHLWL